MFCNNCGAVVTGKYCCCCGRKIRSAVDEFKLQKKNERQRFKESYREAFANLSVVTEHAKRLYDLASDF